MELFYGRNSGNSARSLLCLEEAGVAYTPRLVDPKAGENREAGYLSVNPMGKIPAFADGGFRLWESNAINWYIAEKHPEARLLPTSIEGRAAVQRWLFFQAAHVSVAMRPIMLTVNDRMRTYWGVNFDPAVVEASRKELARYLPILESALAGRDFLEGQFSLADIAYVPHSWLLHEAGFDFSAWPNVNDWLTRLFERPAWGRVRAMIQAEANTAK